MRLLIGLFVLGIGAPIVLDAGTAEAQVWKVKKAKAGGTKTAAKTKTKAKPTARPTVRRKSRASSKPRKVELVPEDGATTDETETERNDRARTDETDEPIIIHVEEVFD